MEYGIFRKKVIILRLALFLLWITAGNAYGAGYEKPDVISAEHQALGGAAVAGVSDAHSIYFNPAGLAQSNPEGPTELVADISPFLAYNEAPLFTGTPLQQSLSTGSKLYMLFGFFLKKKPTTAIGYGLGLYTLAGSGADYGKINVNQEINPEFNVQVGAMELAGGLGYQFSEQLRFGVAFRMALVKGDIKILMNPTTSLSIEDLTGTNTFGLKFGVQLPLNAEATAGLSYRTKIDWKMSGGKITSTDLTTGATTLPSNDGEVLTHLPEQFSIGISLEQNKSKYLLQYDFTKYSTVDFSVSGTAGGIFFETINSNNFNDQHTLRLGLEHRLISDWPVRFGFIINNSVTASNKANPFSLPPGPEYAILAGTGKKITRSLTGDIAFSYLSVSGEATGTDAGTSNGSYATKIYSVHSSLKYAF